MAEDTEIIKERLDIADFIKSYIKLDKAGRNFKGLCPFHKEKTPSMMVSPDRQIWHCFGCGVGGDIFGFLMQYENIEFLDALKVLAEKAGVELKSFTSDQKKYESLYEINRVARDFFRRNLSQEWAKPARQYLKERGLTSEIVNEFEVGLASGDKDELVRHLIKMGYLASEIETAGLAFKTDRGNYWDRFRDRLMFPINNHFGKVVGFTGRILPNHESEKTGKYINSPETPLFNKSKLLFAYDKTKNFIRETNTAVLVEGQMDAIMAYQDGVKNVAATSGTALTEWHLKAVRKIAENLVLAFDNDSAGLSAVERTIDLAQRADFNVKVLTQDDEKIKDPADLVKAHPGELAKRVESAILAMEYYFKFYDILASDISQKKKNIRMVLAKIKSIASAVEVNHWLSQLSRRSSIPEKVLVSEMSAIKSDVLKSNTQNEDLVVEKNVLKKLTRNDRICQRLIAIAVQDEILAKKLQQDYLDLLGDKYQPVLEYVLSSKTNEPDEDIRGLVNLVYLQADAVPIGTVENLVKDENKSRYGGFNQPVNLSVEFGALIDRLKDSGLTTKRKELLNKIAVAEAAKDEAELKKLLVDYQCLTQKGE